MLLREHWTHFFPFDVDAEERCCQMFFPFREQMVATGCQIQAIRSGLPFMAFREYLWVLSCAHLPILQHYTTKPYGWCFGKVQEAKIQISSKVIHWFSRGIDSTFATDSSEIGGRLFLSSAWISVQPEGNSLHHLRTSLTPMHTSPYTSVKWRWISIGFMPFGFQIRITTRISHLAIVSIRRSIR